MPLATRGRKKDLAKAVKVTGFLSYGFKTNDLSAIPGLSASDLTAIGQKDITQGVGIVVFSPRSPRPAQFRKKLTGLQKAVSTFGNGLTRADIIRAAEGGWTLTKPIQALNLGQTAKSKEVVVPLTNNLYVARRVALGQANSENASLLGWVNPGPVTLAKTARAPQGIKPPLVSRREGGSTITLPCAPSKIAGVLAQGWKLVQAESGLAILK